jgi:hypothetical protein
MLEALKKHLVAIVVTAFIGLCTGWITLELRANYASADDLKALKSDVIVLSNGLELNIKSVSDLKNLMIEIKTSMEKMDSSNQSLTRQVDQMGAKVDLIYDQTFARRERTP